jgi:hypothetical protein
MEFPFNIGESSDTNARGTSDGCFSSPTTFEQFTKLAASQLPRRTMLRLAAAGIASAALARFGVRIAYAQSTCLCAGEPYDPQTQCCTATGVEAKYPITDLASCPARVPHSPHVPKFDGCGSSTTSPGLYPYIPNSYGLASFLTCCNNHDVCYDTCNTTKTNCDGSFLGCLTSACTVYLPLVEIAPELYASCLAVADVYYGAVAFFGTSAFDGSQQGACDCCAESACTESCAGFICGSLPACAPGGDCVCFTSTEGNGACIHGDTPCSSVSTCSSTADCPPGTTCVATSCCGSFGVCGPLCNPILPAVAPVRRNTVAPGTRTLGGYKN